MRTSYTNNKHTYFHDKYWLPDNLIINECKEYIYNSRKHIIVFYMTNMEYMLWSVAYKYIVGDKLHGKYTLIQLKDG